MSLVSRPEWTLEAGFREVSASLLSQALRGTLATQPWAHERAKQDPTQIDNMNYKKFCSQSNEKEYKVRRLCCGMLRDQEALRLGEAKMDTQ